MPNNQRVAEQRALNLRRKFIKNSQFQADYSVFMDDIIAKGYAVKVPSEELSRSDGKVWYFPHHGVYHPKKWKIRVVFDSGTSYQGTTSCYRGRTFSPSLRMNGQRTRTNLGI
ncbi:hypothetical protein AAFF_G00003780 [Aldrovandia affinis]|uniref:Uncharacterized protein n=1 Tax=Aldrovandia affinis TaxID=143900 RepID=A0AAD7TDA6_9TELE|nr:hypothetical protein AAFF_G00003780 [Aldrovandia affinis]